MVGILVFVGIAALVGLYVVSLYNRLVQGRNEVKSAYSGIDVQLKRRHDLIPNLLETVKGYAAHEKGTLDAVVHARQQAVSFSGSIEERAKVESALSQSLRSLFALAEAYPDLKANQNFLSLQEELSGTENKIGFRASTITIRQCATRTGWRCSRAILLPGSSASRRNLFFSWMKQPTRPSHR